MKQPKQDVVKVRLQDNEKLAGEADECKQIAEKSVNLEKKHDKTLLNRSAWRKFQGMRHDTDSKTFGVSF